VAFADEIIVIDSGSQDKTVAICQEYTSHVFVTDWPGDGPQRNRGIEKARGEWILCLDADERVSSELAEELQNILKTTLYQGFSIPFLSYYLGKPIRWGDWRKERHTRLFRKYKGHYSENSVYGAQGAHCRPLVDGAIGRLNGKILHYPFPHFEKILQKVNQYSSGSASLKWQKGEKSSLFKAIFRALWSFLRGYILKLGFLDGRSGLMLAISNAEGVYYRYLKLWWLSQSSCTS
jgi:glycosyltransferase involved in cell wall biosynthesis